MLRTLMDLKVAHDYGYARGGYQVSWGFARGRL